MIKELKIYSTFWMFIVYCSFLTAITFLVQSFLITDSIMYNSFAEQLSSERITEMLREQNKWQWLTYTIAPLLCCIKFFAIACCLLAGSMFFEVKLKFSEAFKIALLAEIVFIIPLIIKIFWFLVVQKEYLLQDIQMFSPLSMLNIFDIKTLSLLWFYPLQTINVFELLYIFSLGFWVYQFGAKSYEKGLNMVLGSYVPALFVWVVLVMFITLNLNPAA